MRKPPETGDRAFPCKRDALPTELTARTLENRAFPEAEPAVNPTSNGTERKRAGDRVQETPEIVPNSFVYFIRAGRTNLVKIGWATDVDKRQRELQTASPHPLHLIGYMPGTLFDEAEWHDRFAHVRVRGEWFRLTRELRIAISQLPYADCCFVQFLPLSLLTRNAA